MPGSGRANVAAGEWLRRGDAAPQGDVAVGWLPRSGGQGLQLVVSLTGQKHIWVAAPGDIEAGDAHAPDLEPDPAVGVGVQSRRLAGIHAPQLILATDVVLPVVR